ncbi:BON domain-containing protein [Bowmanella dokdonensis]|uniref:BON domain-containing protein n=1 Tax=Bowmanella dokdonensis TaxID=751969 RepID=A0A939DPI7_9ALTE|nr:BON domain-containing protein [Bowmanella dokdonensis]MBN7826400.1 BON domain-containing protein [Bowmanella dokdonensis]
MTMFNVKKLLVTTAVVMVLGSTGAVAADMTTTQDDPVTNARHEVQIWTTYALSPYLQASDLSVTVLDGKATLTGRVQDSSHKELAEAIAAGVKGVTDVDNQITVDENHKGSPRHTSRDYGDVVADATITTAVKSKLLWSKHTEGMDTKVTTKDGKVELTGTVATKQARLQAEKLAKNTDGVRSVSNKLEVSENTNADNNPPEEDTEAGTAIADSWITTKVKSTFLYSSNVASSDISVSTDRGIVTLAGKVDSGVEHALAIELAQNIRGVKSVSSKQLIH